MFSLSQAIEQDQNLPEEVLNEFMQLLGRDFFRSWGHSGLVDKVRVNRRSIKGLSMQATLRCVAPLSPEGELIWVGVIAAVFKPERDEHISAEVELVFFDIESEERYVKGSDGDYLVFVVDLPEGWRRIGWCSDEFDSWEQAEFGRTASRLGEPAVDLDEEE